MDHGSCKRDGAPLAAKFAISRSQLDVLPEVRIIRSKQVDQFNRSKTGRVPLTGGGAEVAWRQSPSRGGIVLPMQAGGQDESFCTFDTVWPHTTGSDRKPRG